MPRERSIQLSVPGFKFGGRGRPAAAGRRVTNWPHGGRPAGRPGWPSGVVPALGGPRAALVARGPAAPIFRPADTMGSAASFGQSGEAGPESGAPGLVAVLGGEALLQAREGVASAAALAAAGRPADVWSSAGWVPVTVAPHGRTPAVRVLLSDGSSLRCAPSARWPVLAPAGESESRASLTRGSLLAQAFGRRDDGGAEGAPCATPRRAPPWRPKAAAALQIGDRIAPCDVTDLGLGAAAAPPAAAFELGAAAAAAARLGAAAALAGPDVRACVEGWAAARGGSLVGAAPALAELQALLRRAGRPIRTFLEPGAPLAALYIDPPPDWPAGELWARRLRSRQVVVGVEDAAPAPLYSVRGAAAPAGAAVTVAVNNSALVGVWPAEDAGPELETSAAPDAR